MSAAIDGGALDIALDAAVGVLEGRQSSTPRRARNGWRSFLSRLDSGSERTLRAARPCCWRHRAMLRRCMCFACCFEAYLHKIIRVVPSRADYAG